MPDFTARKWCSVAIFGALLLACTAAFAGDLSDIHVNALPPDPAVQAAFTALTSVAPMAADWQPDWRYATPKAQVAATLSQSLHKLQAAAARYPDNEELQLLIGVAGTLANNVDVEGAFDSAAAALTRAHQLDVHDVRPQMLLGEIDCSAPETFVQGMNLLLGEESEYPVSRLPDEFWSAYLMCAARTDMPAHELHASAQLTALGALDASLQTLVTDAHERFVAVDPSKDYSTSQTWGANKTAAGEQFYSTACGIGIVVPGTWGVRIPGIAHGICESVFMMNSRDTAAGAQAPVILVLAQAPTLGQTLAQFAAQHNRAASRPAPVAACPADACLGFRAGVVLAGEKADLYTVVFKGATPRYPGLRFERPKAPPIANSGASGPVYYRPVAKQARLAPTLYYSVSVLTSETGKDTVLEEYKAFLSGIELDASNAAHSRN
ncbi:MAG TPA: hypothetical protein VNE83_02505 [Terriglobales bacterium]|nr:hypothetical protein [Terriglobales bacterium]